MSEQEHRAGFVALIGLPNVGKSTLLNKVLGRKLAIVTPKPQTTRNRILGIESRPNAQYLFVDTPGLHHARNLLGQRMNKVAQQSSADADVVVWIVDAESGVAAAEEKVGRDLTAESRPLVVAVNKIDRAKKPDLLPLMQKLADIAPGRHIVPISAKTGENVDDLLGTIREGLPVSPPLYPADAQTDLPERFFAAEMIREQLLLGTHEEVPYQCAVQVEAFEEREGKNLVVVAASILVGRKSQKAIVIGDKGSRLKEIGMRARLELERFLGVRVYLDLHVKVDARWFTRERALSELGL
ncbi:MAG: GTPase Era [Candidatus Binatia bacterium]|nr:GTPase Era [Candidatus Binatia bacterium]